MKKIAVFASGGGTDFQSVIDANEKESFCEIAMLIASKSGIGAIERAEKHNIPFYVFSKQNYDDLEILYAELSRFLDESKVDYIVLAGWLKIIPESFIKAFSDRIINIHPSLIPAFCGAGYYGLKVHKAVIEYGAKISGCTVHFVNEIPDGGAIIAQRAVEETTAIRLKVYRQRYLKKNTDFCPIALKNFVRAKWKRTEGQLK